MFGSKIVRIPRTFIRQSSVPNAINQNLRPKISNYAYHNTMANQGVQGTVNHSFYIAPDPSYYQEMYNYACGIADGTIQAAVPQATQQDVTALRRTKDDILRSMSSISKSGGNIENQVFMLLSLPYELDVRDYTKAIQSCNNIQLAALVMDVLHQRGLIPDLLLFNVYLKKCEDFKDKEQAFRGYRMLLEDKVVPDKHTMIALIRCCLQSHSPKEAEGVLDDAFNRQVEVNSYMFNLLIDYYARRNQPSESFRLRTKMTQRGIQPDEYTVSSLMAACCPQLPSRTNLLLLLEDVKSAPLPARSVCASALFSGIAKATHLENHQKLRIIVSFFEALRGRGYVLGQHAYTSLMACCSKIGALEQAKLFLEDMRTSGVEANQYILTAFLSTCSKANDYATALQVFNYMRQSVDSRDNKRRPNKYTYEAMLVAAGNAGELEDALQIYADMQGEGIAPDTSTYARLFIVCGLCGDLPRGLQFLEEFNRKGLPRTSFFYHALIDMYSRCGQLNLALDVLEEVKAGGLPPSNYSHHHHNHHQYQYQYHNQYHQYQFSSGMNEHQQGQQGQYNQQSVEATHHHYEPIVRLLVESGCWEKVDSLLQGWPSISYTTLQYLILSGHRQQQWERVLHYEGLMQANGQKPYAALLPLIEEARGKIHIEEREANSAPLSPRPFHSATSPLPSGTLPRSTSHAGLMTSMTSMTSMMSSMMTFDKEVEKDKEVISSSATTTISSSSTTTTTTTTTTEGNKQANELSFKPSLPGIIPSSHSLLQEESPMGNEEEEEEDTENITHPSQQFSRTSGDLVGVGEEEMEPSFSVSLHSPFTDSVNQASSNPSSFASSISKFSPVYPTPSMTAPSFLTPRPTHSPRTPLTPRGITELTELDDPFAVSSLHSTVSSTTSTFAPVSPASTPYPSLSRVFPQQSMQPLTPQPLLRSSLGPHPLTPPPFDGEGRRGMGGGGGGYDEMHTLALHQGHTNALTPLGAYQGHQSFYGHGQHGMRRSAEDSHPEEEGRGGGGIGIGTGIGTGFASSTFPTSTLTSLSSSISSTRTTRTTRTMEGMRANQPASIHMHGGREMEISEFVPAQQPHPHHSNNHTNHTNHANYTNYTNHSRYSPYQPSGGLLESDPFGMAGGGLGGDSWLEAWPSQSSLLPDSFGGPSLEELELTTDFDFFNEMDYCK